MALPSKRAANRHGGAGMGSRRGGKRMEHREPEHREMGYRPRMAEHESHESPASVGARRGPGPEPGAGELDLEGNGPGRAAARKMGMSPESFPSRPTPPGSPPKGMKVYAEE